MVVVARCHQLDNIHAKGNFVCFVLNMYNKTTMRRKMLQLFSFDFALLRSSCLVCLFLHTARFFFFFLSILLFFYFARITVVNND